MKIAGFTFIKNAVKNDYPCVEAITSVLPMVDEMVVLLGDSEDETEALIRQIDSPKIKIFHSVWDANLKAGGKVLAAETDKAFDLISADADWAFYIQGDEVIHEKYHAIIRDAAKQNLTNKKVEGLLFHYLHFYGTYDYVADSRNWYTKEVRIIRNDKRIKSYRDAQGFRINGQEKIAAKLIDAYVFHYGWVKNPQTMLVKMKSVSYLAGKREDEFLQSIAHLDAFDFSKVDSVRPFTDTHPKVMEKRIANQNWEVNLDVHKKKFSIKNGFLYYLEKLTKYRPFAFKNYRIIK
jgi:hypothetical protein